MPDAANLEDLINSKRPPIVPKRTAFFICDMQNDFIRDDGAFPKIFGAFEDGKALIPRIKRGLDAVRQAKIPVFYTGVVNRKDSVDQSVRMSREMGALMEGSWGAQVIEELAPLPTEHFIAKWRYSPFYATPLEAMLRGLNIQTIVLTGVHTNGVIDSSARDGEYRDFSVVVLRDCCAAFSRDIHEAHLKTISSAFGRVISSQEFVQIIS